MLNKLFHWWNTTGLGLNKFFLIKEWNVGIGCIRDLRWVCPNNRPALSKSFCATLEGQLSYVVIEWWERQTVRHQRANDTDFQNDISGTMLTKFEAVLEDLCHLQAHLRKLWIKIHILHFPNPNGSCTSSYLKAKCSEHSGKRRVRECARGSTVQENNNVWYVSKPEMMKKIASKSLFPKNLSDEKRETLECRAVIVSEQGVALFLPKNSSRHPWSQASPSAHSVQTVPPAIALVCPAYFSIEPCVPEFPQFVWRLFAGVVGLVKVGSECVRSRSRIVKAKGWQMWYCTPG